MVGRGGSPRRRIWGQRIRSLSTAETRRTQRSEVRDRRCISGALPPERSVVSKCQRSAKGTENEIARQTGKYRDREYEAAGPSSARKRVGLELARAAESAEKWQWTRTGGVSLPRLFVSFALFVVAFTRAYPCYPRFIFLLFRTSFLSGAALAGCARRAVSRFCFFHREAHKGDEAVNISFYSSWLRSIF